MGQSGRLPTNGDNMKKYSELSKASKVTLWFWTIIGVPTVAFITMIVLTAAGAFGKLPSFEELENPKSNLATEIYSEDGVLLGSYYVQNR